MTKYSKLSYTSTKQAIKYTWQIWNSWEANCPITCGPLKWWGLCIKMDAIPTRITWYGYKYPQIKGDSLHFYIIFILWFQIQCAGPESQKDRNCTPVQRHMDCTVFFHCSLLLRIRAFDKCWKDKSKDVGTHWLMVSISSKSNVWKCKQIARYLQGNTDVK